MNNNFTCFDQIQTSLTLQLVFSVMVNYVLTLRSSTRWNGFLLPQAVWLGSCPLRRLIRGWLWVLPPLGAVLAKHCHGAVEVKHSPSCTTALVVIEIDEWLQWYGFESWCLKSLMAEMELKICREWPKGKRWKQNEHLKNGLSMEKMQTVCTTLL